MRSNSPSNKGTIFSNTRITQTMTALSIPKERSGEPVPENIENWSDANLKDDIIRGIYGVGYENPSPIQRKSISPIVSGKDVIAQAQSGTGKTGAFAVSVLELIDETAHYHQVIILCPTRELAIQSHEVITKIGCNMVELSVKLAVGGTSIRMNSISTEEKQEANRHWHTRKSIRFNQQGIITNTLYKIINIR